MIAGKIAGSLQPNAETEMIAHLSARLVVVTENIDSNWDKWAADRKMVNGESGSVGDVACGSDMEVGRQRSGERRKDMDGLPGSRDALVKVAKQHGGNRSVGPKQRRQMLQVSYVFVPRLAITVARSDVSVAPRNAHSDKANSAAGCIGRSCYESA